MSKVEGLTQLQSQLRSYSRKYGKTNASVTVGFTQNYALHVHENMESAHNVGEAKFLEKPARLLQPELVKITAAVISQGLSMEKALLMAGLRLQRDAQQLTPVDTGALKASAFTCPTEEVEQVSKAAYDRGESRRAKTNEKRKKKKDKGKK